ncbi:MAG: hypothetical protein LBQ16_00115 [Gracilibacteraceae bacterium]|jgi:hypothetical protein|nr:hypothetical protein [Gracilibacteraceae bacterium]
MAVGRRFRALLVLTVTFCVFLVSMAFGAEISAPAEPLDNTEAFQYTEAVVAAVFFSGSNAHPYLEITTLATKNVSKITASLSLYSISPSGTRTRIGYWPSETQYSTEFLFTKNVSGAVSGYQYEFSGTAKVYVGSAYETLNIYASAQKP